MRTLLAALALAIALFVSHAPDAAASQRVRNLLANPDFEEGGDGFTHWSQIVPATVAITRPTFTVGELDPKSGKRCAGIRADYKGGFTSFTQKIKLTRRMKSLHLEGWARLDQVTFGGEAGLVLAFEIPGHEKGGTVARSKTISGRADWTRFVIDTAVPEGATNVFVRCGVIGPSVASFDSLLLTSSERPLRATRLYSVQTDLLLRGPTITKGPRPKGIEDPFVTVPLPLTDDAQALFGLRLNSRPEAVVRSFEVFREGRAEGIRVYLKPVAAGAEIKLRVEGLYLVTDSFAPDERKLIRLPVRNRIPREVMPFVLPTAEIDADHSRVVKARKEIKESDFPAVLREVGDLTRTSLEFGGQADDTASACLESGRAKVAGYANVAAAILRARGVPARTTLALAPGTKGEGHFLVEAWCPQLEWTRLDPIQGRWPCSATEVVTFGNWKAEEHSPRLKVSHRASRMGNWRRCITSGPLMILEDEHAGLLEAADKAYAALIAEPTDGELWFVDEVSHPDLLAWRASTRLVGQ